MKNSIVQNCAWFAAASLFVLGGPQSLRASSMYNVSITTAPLAATAGYLAFDLTGGIPLQNNVATVSLFSSDATLGVASTSGDVAGTLTPGPLTLTADQFFNEWLQPVQFGSTINFRLTVTTNFTAGTPDSFAFFLLDSTQTPFSTSDPSGTDSVFAIDLLPGTTPQVFTSTNSPAQFTATVTPVVVGTTPELTPAGGVALGLTLMLVCWFLPGKTRSA